MLGSASGSLTSYPGHPPAANEGLMSLVPDFILGPRKALDFGELHSSLKQSKSRENPGKYATLGAPFAPTRADRDVLRQYLYRTHESELAHTTSFCDFLMLILHHASQKLVQWYPSGRSSVCGS